MFEGAEHDGAFVDDTSVNVYEFTTLRTKDKAAKDGQKIARLLKHLLSQSANRFKAATGYFVTQEEPTADQRVAVQNICRAENVQIHCMSVLQLQTTLVDVEGYIRLRANAPFGSADSQLPDSALRDQKYVQPTFRAVATSEASKMGDILSAVGAGGNVVITGDFGIGKSAALRELWRQLRKAYFKRPAEYRFPIHINLRDCVGLRSPREILQRHSEEIGFQGASGLVSAWRAGRADLILDGFDELIPARWIGSPRDLLSIRWQALSAVRQLVDETPHVSSVVISGRAQYFSNSAELVSALTAQDAQVFELVDFDAAQVHDYVGSALPPEWLPTRPLFLEMFARSVSEADVEELSMANRGSGWRRLLSPVSEREAGRVSSIPAATFEALISRIAVVARIESDGHGPVTLESMRRVFYEVCGYEAEEEGVQALLRLPGLASTGADQKGGESRTFLDADFADAAFGLELANYVANPFGDHPMCDRAKWATASTSLAAEVAADAISANGFDGSIVRACASKRIAEDLFDAVLFDVVAVAAMLTADRAAKIEPFFADILVGRLELSDDSDIMNSANWSGCMIEALDVGSMSHLNHFPRFQNCNIGRIEGWQSVPAAVASNFIDCKIEEFAAAGGTTAAILQLDLTDTERVALTILKKVYAQSGSGRQLPALSRGLPLDLRPSVEDVVTLLTSKGLVSIGEGKGVQIVRPMREARGAVMSVLNTPSSIASLIGS